MGKRRNQSEHDSMVRAIADHVAATGHRQIKADLTGFSKPDLVRWQNQTTGHIPDVTSNNGTAYLFEVETADSIDDQHTADQWKLFSANAQQQSKRFIVVVPKGSEQRARARAAQLNVQTYDVWTVG